MNKPSRVFSCCFTVLLALTSAGLVSCKKKSSDSNTNSGVVTPTPNPIPTPTPTPDPTPTPIPTPTPTLTFKLDVSIEGDGVGSIQSSPAGIDCGSDCTEVYAENTDVTLTATSADSLSTFSGWLGDCSGTTACAVKMDADKTVMATFSKSQFVLNVTLKGDGSGTVTSIPAGIDCGTDCSESYDASTVVTLKANPKDSFHVFNGWSGACTGTGDCVVTMDTVKDVMATFDGVNFDLQVSLSGTGGGSVSSIPGGIDCGTDCQESYRANTPVTLQSSPEDSFSIFAGWSGACTGTADCVLSMDSAKDVTATFDKVLFDLQVSLAGTGSGSVSSNPLGIDCGTDCSESMEGGTVVTLTATPENSFSLFSDWSGACTGTNNCVVTMDDVKNVTATFDRVNFDLNVTLTGDGVGTVLSTPVGIDCGTDCIESIEAETVVILKAHPDPFSSFEGWSGDCTGTGDCQINMDTIKNVSADFKTISLDGTWSGITSQGKPLSFTVESGGIKQISYEMTIRGIFCSVTFSSTLTLGTPRPITDHAFLVKASVVIFEGTFSSASEASGKLTDSNSTCAGTATVTWDATKDPAAAAVSSLGIMTVGKQVRVLSIE